MSLGILLFLAIGIYGFYLIARPEIIALKYKHDKGIPYDKEMSSEELLAFLTEHVQYPDTKEMHINEQGNVVIVSKYGDHELTIADGKLFVGRGKGKVYTNIEEAECIKTYISHALNSPTSEVPYEKYKKFTNGVKRGRTVKVIIFLASLGIILVSVLKVYNAGVADSIKSKGVSDMCYTDYSDTITIGEALKAGSTDGKWSNIKVADNKWNVTYTGIGADGRVLTLIFQTDENSCDLITANIGGEDYTFYKEMLIKLLYNNAMGVSTEDSFNELQTQDYEGSYNVEDDSSIGDYTNDVMAGAVEHAESELINDTGSEKSEMSIAEMLGNYSWTEGAEEDSHGAEIGITTNETGDLVITGNSWYGAVEANISGFLERYNNTTLYYNDGDGNSISIEFLSNNSIKVTQTGSFGDVTFDGEYQRTESEYQE